MPDSGKNGSRRTSVIVNAQLPIRFVPHFTGLRWKKNSSLHPTEISVDFTPFQSRVALNPSQSKPVKPLFGWNSLTEARVPGSVSPPSFSVLRSTLVVQRFGSPQPVPQFPFASRVVPCYKFAPKNKTL